MSQSSASRMAKIGLLHVVGPDEKSQPPVDMDYFKQGMKKLGYEEGLNVEYRTCFGNRDLSLVRKHADDLVAWPADVIVSFLTNSNLVAMEATKESGTPVVGWGTDHVVARTVESNRRPGKNFTGFSYIPFIYGARVRLMRMCVPHARKVAHLYNPNYSPAPAALDEFRDILNDFGIDMPVHEALSQSDLEPTVEAMRRDGCEAVMVGPHGLFNTNGPLLGKLFLEHRLPAFGNQLTIPQYGGVGAMGPPHQNGWPEMAKVVDRILKGEKPGEIPINRSLRGETVINVKAASLLSLDLPPALIDEADVVLTTVD
jgi:putative ABC transport system substrate-binding protein